MHAPMAQGQSEIIVVVGQSRRRGRIEYSTQSHGRIEQEAAQISPCRPQFSLQGVVEHDRRHIEIGKEIGDAGTDGRGHDPHVGLGHRLEEGAIDLVVDLVDSAVPRLPGILRQARAVGGQRDTGACAQYKGNAERRARVPCFQHSDFSLESSRIVERYRGWRPQYSTDGETVRQCRVNAGRRRYRRPPCSSDPWVSSRRAAHRDVR